MGCLIIWDMQCHKSRNNVDHIMIWPRIVWSYVVAHWWQSEIGRRWEEYNLIITCYDFFICFLFYYIKGIHDHKGVESFLEKIPQVILFKLNCLFSVSFGIPKSGFHVLLESSRQWISSGWLPWSIATFDIWAIEKKIQQSVPSSLFY